MIAVSQQLEKMSTMIDPKLKWKAMSNLAAILVGNGMTIFGSFVSTQILHNDHANKFYNLRDPTLLYPDPTCHPELGGRLILPSDIDVICSSANYKKIMQFLDQRYFVRRVNKLDMAYRHWMCSAGDYFLHKNEIITAIEGEFVVTSIDFVVQHKEGDIDLPNKVDADVNGLMLSSAGMKIHSSVRDFYPRYQQSPSLLVQVIQNVLNRKCIVRTSFEISDDVWDQIVYRRVKKLRDKGYALEFKYEQIHFIHDAESAGDCTICLQESTGSQCKLAGCDCNSRFCAECLIQAIDTDRVTKCPMCREDIDMPLAKIDIAVFNAYNGHTPPNTYRTLFKHR